jgi:hypothetical protein
MKRRLLALLLISASILTALGCAVPSAQATPFFEDGKASPERINLWPIYYHDGPATSILWPVGEHIEDERLLVWPFYSQEELGEGKRRYGALGPLVAFNQKTGDNRIVPVFWGAHYLVVFPLLWLYPGDARGCQRAAATLDSVARSAVHQH